MERQIRSRLLHPQASAAGKPIAYWLSSARTANSSSIAEIFSAILGDSLNICDEISKFLERINHKYRAPHIAILLGRYGLANRTLEDIGNQLGMTRERVRQICGKLKARVVNPRFTCLRIQSALLIAADMGQEITFQHWSDVIRSSGIVGDWTSDAYHDIDPIEALIAICNLAGPNSSKLTLPDNLRLAVDLAISGKPHLAAWYAVATQSVSKVTSKIIKRHTAHSGGVNARWLSREINVELENVSAVLSSLGYEAISKDWFIPGDPSDPKRTSKDEVCHRTLQKMLHYCGALTVDELCGGLRSVLSRQQFPVPPPDVMQVLLARGGYKSSGGLYSWTGEHGETLSRSEEIILDCLKRERVVHHAELTKAFQASGLSFPALHAALRHSPLFSKVEPGLYRIRGSEVTRQDVDRARSAGESIPASVEVEYDKRGLVSVKLTLSVIGAYTGNIACTQLPNLKGEWSCLVSGRRSCMLVATEAEFRRLRKPFELLKCQAGDRIHLLFNTWDRTVVMEKVQSNYGNQ